MPQKIKSTGSNQGGAKSRSQVKDPLAHDFRNFLYAIWKHLGLPPPTDVQYDIATYIQHGPQRCIIEAFRGVGKSWITASYACWLLYNDVDHKVLVVSANATKATEFTAFVLRLLTEVPFLAHLKPGNGDRQSMVSFDVAGAKPSQSPSVKSIGITGQITGGRANTIIADDIEIPGNSDTPHKREKLMEQVKEFDAVIIPGGRIMYLGTAQSEQTIYVPLQDRGYVARIWPARFPENHEVKYGATLAPLIVKRLAADASIVGQTTDPNRFTDEDLLERELSYGKSGFALQFMLDTTLSDAEKHPLKLSDLIIAPLDPFRGPTDLVWASSPDLVWKELPAVGFAGDRYYRPAWLAQDYAPYEGSAMFIDPSGKGKDETAYAVVKQLHGRLFLTASGGFLGTGYSDEVLEGLLRVAKKQQVNIILTEPNYGGGMFAQLLRSAAHKHYGVTIEDATWSNVQKEQRIIDTLEPVMNQHRLVVDPAVVSNDYKLPDNYGDRGPNYRLFYQLTRLTKERGCLAQDDRLDALAGCVAYWLDHMARDTEDAALAHKDQLLQKELDKFIAHSQGYEPGDQRIWASQTSKSSLH